MMKMIRKNHTMLKIMTTACSVAVYSGVSSLPDVPKLHEHVGKLLSHACCVLLYEHPPELKQPSSVSMQLQRFDCDAEDDAQFE